MPTYDYHCDWNSRTVSIQHSMKETIRNWGELCQHDWKENEVGLTQGQRLFSRYKDRGGTYFYIITEHDRSVTTVLLTGDY